MHRRVWEVNYGPIPSGFHVHHIDDDRNNNQPSNLALMDASGHLSHHGKSPRRAAYSRMHIERIREKASMWHGSKAGVAWHKKHYQEHCAKALHARTLKSCKQCAKFFMGSHHSIFCGNNCKSAYRRGARLDMERRLCPVCHDHFMVNRYARIKTCGPECGAKLSAANRRGVSQRKRL